MCTAPQKIPYILNSSPDIHSSFMSFRCFGAEKLLVKVDQVLGGGTQRLTLWVGQLREAFRKNQVAVFCNISSNSKGWNDFSHYTLRKLVHFKKGAHANDESLTKVVDFW